MVDCIKIYESKSHDVFYNQAIELTLFNSVKDNEYILYIWSNDNTIVIGRNQDVYAECDVELFEKDGGKIARRLSGGGAVYHNLGNVNFTFIAKSKNFSLDLNRKIIYDSLKNLGLNPSFTGRNDIEIDGYKVSGNAYYKKNDTQYHHGTMLISSSPAIVAKYLTPDKSKLVKNKVQSVSSRVSYLKNFNDKIDIETFVESIEEVFIKSFNTSRKEGVCLNENDISKNRNFFADTKWRFNKNEYDFKVSIPYNNEIIILAVKMDKTVIKDINVITDSLTYEFDFKNELVGKDINKDSSDILDKIKDKYYGI